MAQIRAIQEEFGKSNVENPSKKLMNGVDDFIKNICALKTDCKELEQLKNLSIIHMVQFKNDYELLYDSYHRLHCFMERSNNLNFFEQKLKTAPIQADINVQNPLDYELIPKNNSVSLIFSKKFDNPICTIQYSPSGKLISFADGKTIYIIFSSDFTIFNQILIPQEVQNIPTKCLRFSPNESFIAVTSSNNSIFIFTIENGALYTELKEHASEINRLLFSPDSQFLFSCDSSGKLCKWNISERSLSQSISTTDNTDLNDARTNIVSLVLSDNGAYIYAIYMYGIVGKFNVLDITQKEFTKIYHNGFILNSSQNINGFATVSQDKSLKIWAVNNGIKCQGEYYSHTDWVLSCCSAGRDSPIFITGAKDQTIKIWNLNNKEKPIVTILMCANSVFELTHCPCDKRFASCTGDGTVCVWEYQFV